jgi:ZIP family zinc transporter
LRLEERSSDLGDSGYRLESDGAELYAEGAGPFFAEGFGITFLAGLSTAVGGLLAVARKGFSPRTLCLSLSLAAGLMLAFSLTAVQGWFGAPHTPWGDVGVFCAAFLLLAVLERALPHSACPACGEQPPGSDPDSGSGRTGHVHAPGHAGTLTAFALSVHNFPEGFAVFSAAAADPGLGLALMGAVAAHNIPLGMAIALPLYHNSGKRGRAFLHALLAGLTQPAGALLGFLALSPVLTPAVQNLLFSCAGGIMAAVAVTELFPAARRDGDTSIAVAGLGAGMILMGAVLLLFPHG